MTVMTQRKPKRFKLFVRRKDTKRIVNTRCVTAANAERMKHIMRSQCPKGFFVDSYTYDLYKVNRA